jgi:hypothetical protein
MFDYAGPLQRIVLSHTLWLVVAWPILGFAWQVLVARRRIARTRSPDTRRRALASARNAGLSCMALAMASTLAHAVVLARAPEGPSALFEPLARGARIGQLDAEFDLLFDTLGATFCALACLVALGVAVFVAVRPIGYDGWRPWAWMQLSLAGALLSFVADGSVGTALGWSIAGAAGAWLAGWNDARAGIVVGMRGALSVATMLVGAVLLFWGLGGSWDGDDYTPDPEPRVAAAHVRGEEEPGTPPRLTFTSAPGAVVFLDDARSTSMQSPFVAAPVQGGMHALRVHTSDGSNDQVLGRVLLEEAGEEVALVPLGSTLTFRVIADQLALRDREGSTPVRSALEARSGPSGAAVIAASLLALLLAAGIMSGAPPSGGAPPVLTALAQGATAGALGPYAVARVAFLFPLAPSTWIAVESVGAAILLVGGWRAPTAPGIRRWLAFVGVAPAALAFLALGAAGVTAASYVMVLAGAATAALCVAVSGPTGRPERRAGAGAAWPPEGQSAELSLVGPFEELLLVGAPMRLGALLVSMDRWVVSAIASTISALARAGAWVVATLDRRVVMAPANALAARLLRLERRVEPLFGAKPGRLAWAFLAAVAVVLCAHALWPGE